MVDQKMAQVQKEGELSMADRLALVHKRVLDFDTDVQRLNELRAAVPPEWADDESKDAKTPVPPNSKRLRHDVNTRKLASNLTSSFQILVGMIRDLKSRPNLVAEHHVVLDASSVQLEGLLERLAATSVPLSPDEIAPSA
jgi:uncharacterized coiled-coil protein SlyX